MLDAEEELELIAHEARHHEVLDDEWLQEPIATLCKRPAETIGASQDVGTAIRKMRNARIGSLAVVDEETLVGIVTERDILSKVALEAPRPEAIPVRSIMTADPETLEREDPIVLLMNKMYVGGFRHVPIVDREGRALHVISIREVVGHVLASFERTVCNVPPDGDARLRKFL